jgi:hypothetical protein
MRFAVGVPNFGDFADPRVVADLARRAEPMVRRAEQGPPPRS